MLLDVSFLKKMMFVFFQLTNRYQLSWIGSIIFSIDTKISTR